MTAGSDAYHRAPSPQVIERSDALRHLASAASDSIPVDTV